jgi:stress-induced-phosphoprotein 1
MRTWHAHLSRRLVRQSEGTNQVIAYSNRSAALLNLKRFGEALEDANTCMQLDPGFVKAYGRKAAALLGLRR